MRKTEPEQIIAAAKVRKHHRITIKAPMLMKKRRADYSESLA
jgi:hypothetical protein